MLNRDFEIHTVTGYPETLQLGDTMVPSATAPNHIIFRVNASALNPPVYIPLMNFSLQTLPLPGFRGPKIVSKDFACVVLAMGSGISSSKGDEIMGVSTSLDGSSSLIEAQAASLPLVWLSAYTPIKECVPFRKNPTPAYNRIAILSGARERGWTVLAVDYTTTPDGVGSAVASFKPDSIVDCVGGTECISLASRYVTIGTEPKQNDIVIDSIYDFSKVKGAYERLNIGQARGKVVIGMLGS
ncbi:alcohol dehydrogenase [Camillea tinctor]|nr:alcohol dehydrogenase [Camillea tinctor]